MRGQRVFFDNVEVPADQLIGQENKGWTYAKHLLSHERTNIADVNRAKRELERLKRIARAEAYGTTSVFATRSPCWRWTSWHWRCWCCACCRWKKRQEPAGHRRPLEDQGQRDPAALRRADDAGRRLPYALPRSRRPWTPGWQGLFPGGTCLGQTRRWPRPTSTCARPPSTAAAMKCNAISLPKPSWALTGDKHMDFDFSDDQQQLRDAVRRWVDKGYTFERRRAIVAAGGFERAAYGELAELGLTALTVPEAHGGLGQGAIDAMVVMEELGRGIVLEPLAQAFVTAGVLAQYAPPRLQAAWLPAHRQWRGPGGAGQQERKARYRLDVCEAKRSWSPMDMRLQL